MPNWTLLIFRMRHFECVKFRFGFDMLRSFQTKYHQRRSSNDSDSRKRSKLLDFHQKSFEDVQTDLNSSQPTDRSPPHDGSFVVTGHMCVIRLVNLVVGAYLSRKNASLLHFLTVRGGARLF